MTGGRLPGGVALVRTTPTFDQDSVPAGLRSAHRIAEGVWGRLVVFEGALHFVIEDDPPRVRRVGAGGEQVISPGEVHHIEIDGPVRFVIEFLR